MKTFEYLIHDEYGIHARPAGQLVKLAGSFHSRILVQKAEKQVDAKRLLAVMGLCAKKGDSVAVTADGGDEAEAIQALKQFFAAHL